MTTKDDKGYDDSQIAMKVAIRASLFVSISFFLFGLVQFAFPRFPFDWLFEIVLRFFLVIFGVAISRGFLKFAVNITHSSGIPFLSTVFFYGMMLLMMTLLQLMVVLFHLFFSDVFSFAEEMKMLFGVRDFSINSLVLSMILGHLPYIVYFFYIRFLLNKICNSVVKN